MQFSREELQDLLVVVKNQLSIQKIYGKKIKKKKNTIYNFSETEQILNNLASKINNILKEIGADNEKNN